MNNPYPEYLEDESSGVLVKDLRHELWQEGYNAGRGDEKREIVRDLEAIDRDTDDNRDFTRRVCDLLVELKGTRNETRTDD